jgi:glycerol-3-phosphate acyltransferase PlsY
MSNIWKFVILIIVSYFFGNITFARFVARTRNNDDITTHGSGNPGTTNMLRTHGLTLAIVTLVLDALKSVICCVVAYFWLKPESGYLANLAVYVSGLSCIIGHIYPVIFKFKVVRVLRLELE